MENRWAECHVKKGLKDLKQMEKHWSLFVAAHLRGVRPTPSRQKDTLMLREKLKLLNQ